jgi:hypothetical protein
MKYCNELVEVYSKMNFIIDMTWEEFVSNGHYKDIIHYLNCLNDPENPSNNNKFMKKPFVDDDIKKLNKYYLTFDESIYKYLTEISQSYIDDSFTSFFSKSFFDERSRNIQNVTNDVKNFVINKDKIFIYEKNEYTLISVDTFFTNTEYFMINLPFDWYNNHLELGQLCIYLGETLQLDNFILKNGSIWRQINKYTDEDEDEDEDVYVDANKNKQIEHIKRCNECDHDNFTSNDYHDHNYITYELLMPSILDLCVLTFYHGYQPVCRWGG